VQATLAPEITVRRVSWDRVEASLRDLEAQAAASDVHPDEWSEERKQAAKGTLLRGLQISQPGDRVMILGRSQFKTSDGLPEQDSTLRALGTRLGANMVVYSTRVLGKTDKIVQSPVTGSTTGTGWRRERDGNYRPDTYSETSTTWIPIRVTTDETGGIAYYLYVAR